MYYLPYCDITLIKCNPQTVNLLKKDYLVKHCCIPFDFNEMNPNEIRVAFGDIPDEEVISLLNSTTRCDVEPYLAAPTGILEKLREMFPGEGIEVHEEKAEAEKRKICPHFGICGGCSYISLPYEAELKIKTITP